MQHQKQANHLINHNVHVINIHQPIGDTTRTTLGFKNTKEVKVNILLP